MPRPPRPTAAKLTRCFSPLHRTKPAKEVYVTGTFDDWKRTEKLEPVGDVFEKTVTLPDSSKKILYKVRAGGCHTSVRRCFRCVVLSAGKASGGAGGKSRGARGRAMACFRLYKPPSAQIYSGAGVSSFKYPPPSPPGLELCRVFLVVRRRRPQRRRHQAMTPLSEPRGFI